MKGLDYMTFYFFNIFFYILSFYDIIINELNKKVLKKVLVTSFGRHQSSPFFYIQFSTISKQITLIVFILPLIEPQNTIIFCYRWARWARLP